jgi:hypothetical protein
LPPPEIKPQFLGYQAHRLVTTTELQYHYTEYKYLYHKPLGLTKFVSFWGGGVLF